MKKWIACLSLAISASANATIITLDADSYSNGTDVTHAIGGAALWSYSQSGTSSYAPVISPISVMADSTGSRVFGRSGPGYSPENFRELNAAYNCQLGHPYSCGDGYQTMHLTFERPTDYVGIETDWRDDHPGLYAFDSAGQLLFSCLGLSAGPCARTTTSLADGQRTLFEFSRADKDVARVMFGGVYGANRVGAISVSVPEPSSILLFGLALAGAAVARRRRATST
jgi:hypothetical protein